MRNIFKYLFNRFQAVLNVHHLHSWVAFLVPRFSVFFHRRPLTKLFIFAMVFGAQVPSGAAETCSQVFISSTHRFGPSYDRVVAPIIKNPKFSSSPRILTTQFLSTGSYTDSTSVQRVQGAKAAFAPGKVRRDSRIGYRLDEMVIGEVQDFSMATMVTSNYLTPQDAKMFRELGTRLEEGQVTISEVIRDATYAEIRDNYGQDLGFRDAGYRAEFNWDKSNLTPVKTAALWTVSGQVWNREQKSPRLLKLPWELEEARRGQELDREKYPFVFEWGRASQEVAGEIAPLYSLNGLQNLLQVKAFNGKLSDAYVMVHSFDPVNTRLYAMMTKNGYYPSDAPINPKDQLFITPLEWAIAAHPPSRVSQRVADIVKWSDNGLTEIEAVSLLIENRERRWTELDYQRNGRKQEYPITVNDMSLSRLYSMMEILRVYPGKRDGLKKILDHLIDWSHDFTLMQTTLPKKYANAADSVTSSYVYKDRNAIELSNLDVKMAVRDPEYAKSVLFSGLMYQLERVALIYHRFHGLPWEESVANAKKMIQSHKTQFGVTTHVPLIQYQLNQLNPVAREILPKTQLMDGGTPSKHNLENFPYHYRDAEMFFFTADQIMNWAVQNPTLAKQNPGVLTQGKWRSQYLMSQADLF